MTHYARQRRDQVIVRIDDYHATPYELVKRAVATKAKEMYDAKRGRGRAHDQIWCVFDRDEHPKFAEALQLAAKYDIKLAISNPCIELWFVLHFERQTADLHRHAAQQRYEALLGCGKSLNAAALIELSNRFVDATNRAKEVDKWHVEGHSPAGQQSKQQRVATHREHQHDQLVIDTHRPSAIGRLKSSSWQLIAAEQISRQAGSKSAAMRGYPEERAHLSKRANDRLLLCSQFCSQLHGNWQISVDINRRR